MAGVGGIGAESRRIAGVDERGVDHRWLAPLRGIRCFPCPIALGTKHASPDLLLPKVNSPVKGVAIVIKRPGIGCVDNRTDER